MKAYKAMNKDQTCRGFKFEEGEIYEIEGSPALCEHGFHFCKDLVLTLEYYPVREDINENVYAEIEVLGEVEFEKPAEHKGVTNKLKVLRIIPDNEVSALADGKDNIGHWNSGDWNIGSSNSGSRNSGHWNSGGWNSCHFETGFFNSEQSKTVRVFNKPCSKTEWDNADKPDFLYFEIDDELGYKGSFQKSFRSASEHDIKLLKALPNFDADVFFEISGISI